MGNLVTSYNCCARGIKKVEIANEGFPPESSQLLDRDCTIKSNAIDLRKIGLGRHYLSSIDFGNIEGKKVGIWLGGCCLGLGCIHAIVILALVIQGRRQLASLEFDPGHQAPCAGGALITPVNVSEYEWWPGCDGPVDDFTNCGAACCDCNLVEAFRAYNSQINFTAIQFRSRRGGHGQEGVSLRAWWLPAEGDFGTAPVVVLQHGVSGSINDMHVQLAAFLIRSVGFSVLLPSLRGHDPLKCSQGQSSGTWGLEDYPLDTLGAWDYVVSDPAGLLGGRRPPRSVGLMGLSLGGFVAATAFGLERRVPALWMDGAPWDPLDLLATCNNRGALAASFRRPACALVGLSAGLGSRRNTPWRTLPSGPASNRPVMVMHGQGDIVAPKSSAERYIELFTQQRGQYKVSARFDLDGVCQEQSHNMLPWLHPMAYRSALCDFWSSALLKANCSAPDIDYL
mmetsp:Transcript_145476/g.405458  ORF Transcript_145476/g.405458 Transcript_145476/m.405458 type:complete len:454 (+) Transcript_145476:103-1464(+)